MSNCLRSLKGNTPKQVWIDETLNRRHIPVCFVGLDFLEVCKYYFAEVDEDTVSIGMNEAFEMPWAFKNKIASGGKVSISYTKSSVDQTVIAVNLTQRRM